ncbi:hypothetical protein WCD74_27085 [Actinomycetospora sp. OC33-EN08]|uniref:DUF6985 domain-containing protein n=1 Tax=Actinomycetospora aurantiaca TaxID=3129233 RepID=A0ABU8MX11_9PSEU
MVTERLRQLAATVADLLDRAEADVPAAPEEHRRYDEAVAAIRAGGAELLDTATPYLWMYYRDVAATVDAEDLGIAPLGDGDDIWEHVRLRRPPTLATGFGSYEPSPCYVDFHGGVTWEPEHGLQLVFDHTGRLCRVGPVSGHLTVAAADSTAPPDAIYG